MINFEELKNAVGNVTYQPYTVRHLMENGLDPKGKQFCSQAGYNFFRMTAERRETACIVSGMGLLNGFLYYHCNTDRYF